MHWTVVSINSRLVSMEHREEGKLLGVVQVNKWHLPPVELGDVLRIEVDAERSRANKREVGWW